MGEGGREIVCGKSLLFFLIKKALAGDRIVMISPRSRIHALFCVAGFRPGGRATFVSAKVAKTSDAPSGFKRGAGRKFAEGGPTRRAQTRSARG
jgi:hypothetical protein